MLSNHASISGVLAGPIDEWDLNHILNVFGSIAEITGYSDFPVRCADIKCVLNKLIDAMKDPSNEHYSHILLLVLMTLLSLLLLASRSVISPLNLRLIGLGDCIFINMINIKMLRSNPYTLGLIFLLWLHKTFVDSQDQNHDQQSNQPLNSPTIISHQSPDSIDINDIRSVVDLLSLTINCVANIHRTGSNPTHSDQYFVYVAFYAFHRHSSRLSETIINYANTRRFSNHHELEHCATTINTPHKSDYSTTSLISSNLIPEKSLLLMASMCIDASSDLLNESDPPDPSIQNRIAQDCFNPPSTKDASYIAFLIEIYFILFPDKSTCIADVLCYVPYLPQRFISPLMGLLAPPILTELSFNIQVTTRNRCILGLVFVNAVLAQTVIAYQYVTTARCLLKQMKFSWIKAYVPLSVLSSNNYFFGARSKVFQLTVLDDDEYINEMRLLLNNQQHVNESPKDGSRRNNVRRSKK